MVGRHWEEVAPERSVGSGHCHRSVLRPRPLDVVCDRPIEHVSLWGYPEGAQPCRGG